jgi:hypothetical protein
MWRIYLAGDLPEVRQWDEAGKTSTVLPSRSLWKIQADDEIWTR